MAALVLLVAAFLLLATPAEAAPLLTPLLVAGFAAIGVVGTTATILAEVIVIGIGIGLSLLVSVLFRSSPPQPKPSDGQSIIRQATAPRFRSYGRVKVGGVMMFANSQQGFFYRVIAMGSGEIDSVQQHWIDDNEVHLAGNTVTDQKYQNAGASRVHIEFTTGTDNPSPYFALINANPGVWTFEHLGRGIPSALVVLQQVKQDQIADMFPALASTGYRQVQHGARVLWVGGGVFQGPIFTDNAALVIMDYLTHPDGLGLNRSWIANAIAEWETAQNDCSEQLPSNVSPTGLEGRYRIWNTYRFDERPAEVLQRFLQACDAVVFPTPDRGLSIKVGKWTEPTVMIDDDAILGFSEFGHGRDILTTANTIRARYTSEDHDFLETDADPMILESDVTARGELALDINLFAVPSHSQCRRLMKLTIHRANPNWVGTLQCNLRALPVMGERFIRVRIAELGIDESFEVINTQVIIEQGSILRGVQVQISALSAAAYDWTGGETRALEPGALALGGDMGTPPAIPPPIVPSLELPAPENVTTAVAGSMVAVSWLGAPDDFIEAEVRFKQVTAVDWLAAPVAVDATSVHIGPLAAVLYEFQVRNRSSTSGRVTDWTISYTATPEADATPPGSAAWQIGHGLVVDTGTDPDTLSLAVPVPIADGGTGAITAPLALANLGGAPLASPVFTGDPRAPTAAPGDADTSVATTAFVAAAASGLAPLNTGVLVVTPASGATVTMGATDRALRVNTAALAALTVRLPPTPAAGFEVQLNFAAPVTALAVQDSAGAAVPGGPSNAYGPGAAIVMRFVGAAWVYWK